MSRTRYLKPDFFLDEELADLRIETRMLFAGLWTLADREGRLEDRPKRIKAQIFPWDAVDVEAMLTELAAGLFIQRYEANGKRFIQITNFGKHQRPHIKEAASLIPTPPEPGKAPASTGNARPRTGIYGDFNGDGDGDFNGDGDASRGKPRPAAAPGFEDFWMAYPRKVGKQAARTAWTRIKPSKATAEAIIEAVGKQKVTDQWTRDGGRFVPNPATWINQGRWEDDPTTFAKTNGDKHAGERAGEAKPKLGKYAHLG